MDIYRIAFIGHREINGYYQLEDKIGQIARDMLCEKEYVEFYVGRRQEKQMPRRQLPRETDG